MRCILTFSKGSKTLNLTSVSSDDSFFSLLLVVLSSFWVSESKVLKKYFYKRYLYKFHNINENNNNISQVITYSHNADSENLLFVHIPYAELTLLSNI